MRHLAAVFVLLILPLLLLGLFAYGIVFAWHYSVVLFVSSIVFPPVGVLSGLIALLST